MESLKIQKIIFGFLFLSPLALAQPRWVMPPSAIYQKLQSELSLKTGDYLKRKVTRLGNQTIELEGVASINGKLENFYAISKDVPRYRHWALPRINQKPSGGYYLLKILDLKPVPAKPNEIVAQFGLNFPGFKTVIERGFSIFSERGQKEVTVTCESTEAKNSILSKLVGYIMAFPHPRQKERLWVYFQGKAKLESWLLYQALPEQLLATESSERIQTVLENFGEEEIVKNNQR